MVSRRAFNQGLVALALAGLSQHIFIGALTIASVFAGVGS
jgi:hypothetical protein